MGLVALMLTYGIAVAAEDVERLSELRALGDCENCAFEDQDFSGRKLIGINLSNAALDNVVFDNSELNISLFERQFCAMSVSLERTCAALVLSVRALRM